VRKALSKRATDRHKDARDLHSDLTVFSARWSPPTTCPPRDRRWRCRRARPGWRVWPRWR
jgi:hypothetical protein